MARLSPEEVISYPVMSEDSVKLIETENKITFIIDGRANKNDVRRAVEELYEVDVWKVHTLTAPDGRKKAYVKLSPESKASDLAVKLGILSGRVLKIGKEYSCSEAWAGHTSIQGTHPSQNIGCRL